MNHDNLTPQAPNARQRWVPLVLLSIVMLLVYSFMDILSPIQDLCMTSLGWTNDTYGKVQASQNLLNVLGFLVAAGVLVDKLRPTRALFLSSALMLSGGLLLLLGLAPSKQAIASVGQMLFGSGAEMGGIAVTCALAKHYAGGQLALAMGTQVAISRLGVATVMIFAPMVAAWRGNVSVERTVTAGIVGLAVALALVIAYHLHTRGSSKHADQPQASTATAEPELPFWQSAKLIILNPAFWLITLLCLLYYSAIYPFQKYAVNMLQCNLTLTPPPAASPWASPNVALLQYTLMATTAAAALAYNFIGKRLMRRTALALALVALAAYCLVSYRRQTAESIFALFPLLALGITPVLGKRLDQRGRAADMLILGSLLLLACHLTFALALPSLRAQPIVGLAVAYATILLLGASFSLVPAALWPSVTKIVPPQVIGTAYSLIFWIQNIGLCLFPLVIGKLLDRTNPAAALPTELSYTAPLLMLAALGLAALISALALKSLDKLRGYGLQLPNQAP